MTSRERNLARVVEQERLKQVEAAKQELAKQELAKQETAMLMHSVKTVPQIAEEVIEVLTPTPISQTVENLQIKTMEIFIGEAVKAAAYAKTDETKALAMHSGFTFKEKVEARNASKAKLGSANDLVELKLKAKGEGCNEEQLKGCSIPLKELFYGCVTQYADDKCSDEAFNDVINNCVGKCLSDLPDVS